MIKTFTLSGEEEQIKSDFVRLIRDCPIPSDELENNLPVFLTRQAFSRTLFMHEIYKQIVGIHGVVMEFGVRWGRNIAMLQNFKAMYEPYNHFRKIIGFDTFEGFPSVHEHDGGNAVATAGAYAVTRHYEDYLAQILKYNQLKNPLPHIQTTYLVKGNALETLPKYLAEHPETMIAMAYFDFDLYEPTQKCLELIRPYLIKGAVIGFDELGSSIFPGETVAFREFFKGQNVRVERFPFDSVRSYCVIE